MPTGPPRNPSPSSIPSARLDRATKYFVRPVVNGVEGEPGKSFSLPANAAPLPYVAVPIQTPEGYTPNDASLGDLDGDGDYEIILKQEQRPRDNSQAGMTGEAMIVVVTVAARGAVGNLVVWVSVRKTARRAGSAAP